MRKLIVTEFISLDGVIEGPGPGDPYEHAGWTMLYSSDEIGKFKFEELMACDVLLLGRITYDGFAKAWPTMEGTGEFGEKMNNMEKYVVSTTLHKADWNNSHIIKDNVAAEVAKLKASDGKDIMVAGSSVLIKTLLELGLVDEINLLVYPVVLDSGKRLFKEGQKPKFKLLESKPFGEVVLLRYETKK